MGFDKEVTLKCDADGCWVRWGDGYSTARYTREQAPDGWSNYGRFDYCPAHSPSDNSRQERKYV